jgi:hypothetical protein
VTDEERIAATLTAAAIEGDRIRVEDLFTAARLLRELEALRAEDRLLRACAEEGSRNGWDFGLRWHQDRRTWRVGFYHRVNRWWNREHAVELHELRSALAVLIGRTIS